MINFQLLMLSPNLLKSQSPIMVGGEGKGVDDQFPTFDAESKSAKITKSHYRGWGELVTTNFQLSMLRPDLLKSQSSIMVGLGGGEVGDDQFQLLMLSPHLLKSQKSHYGGGREVDDQFPTFNAESKSAKIQKCHYGGGGSW